MSKFWADDISQLFCKFDLIPRSDETLDLKLNAITRLAVLICLLIAFFKPVLAVSTFGTAIVTILCIYYSSNVPKEKFTESIGTTNQLFKPQQFNLQTSKRFCNDLQPIQFNEQFVSKNQALIGGPNPKTLIPPILAPPSHDLSAWKASDFVVHSAINSETTNDVSSSGYCGNIAKDYFGYSNLDSPVGGFEPLTFSTDSRYDQLTTQTLQPGVFQQSDLSEPINSNIGISEQKQFDVMKITKTPNSVKYTALSLDNLLRNFDEQKQIVPSEDNVFDPRFSGYGSENRGYLDPTTGQPRWFYDDINAVRMPNFIARNNIDVFPWAAQYGSGINGNIGGISYGDGYKQLANNAFCDGAIQFRTEMQERLMRKRNAELWQQRLAPISTMSNSGKF